MHILSLHNLAATLTFQENEELKNYGKDLQFHLQYIDASQTIDIDPLRSLLTEIQKHPEFSNLSKEMKVAIQKYMEDILNPRTELTVKIDPWQLARNLSKQFSDSKRSITISNYPDGVYPLVELHYLLTKLTLENLLTNAIKYAKKDIRIIIHLTQEAGLNSLAFQILDDGSPFPESALLNLSHTQASPTETGSGIGLAACRSALIKTVGDDQFELSFHNSPEKHAKLTLRSVTLSTQPFFGRILENDAPIVVIIEDQLFNQRVASGYITKNSPQPSQYVLVIYPSTGIAEKELSAYAQRVVFIGSDQNLSDTASPQGSEFIRNASETYPNATLVSTSSSPPREGTLEHIPLSSLKVLITRIEDVVATHLGIKSTS